MMDTSPHVQFDNEGVAHVTCPYCGAEYDVRPKVRDVYSSTIDFCQECEEPIPWNPEPAEAQ